MPVWRSPPRPGAPASSAGGPTLDVFGLGVRAGEQQGLVAAVRPADDVRGGAILAPDLHDLARVVRVAHVMAPDHDAITDVRSHVPLLLGRPASYSAPGGAA